jgi:hypothetical protein
MLTRRLQILLDERRYERLSAYARERNLSVGAAVREVIDQAVPLNALERDAAVRELLAAPPMPVPAQAELRLELDELRGRRG